MHAYNSSSDGSAAADRVNIFLHHENQKFNLVSKQLPVTIVAGPLGAGKTSLLNHILSNKRNLRIAAAVNDFAAINIDSESVKRKSADTGVVALTNGCVCCSKASDLVAAIWTMLQDADVGKVDYVVIETSGVSDPVTIIQQLEAEYGKMYRVRLDSVVAVLDADDFWHRITSRKESNSESYKESGKESNQESNNESNKENSSDDNTNTNTDTMDTGSESELVAITNTLSCADVLLLNKCDLVSREQIDCVKTYLDTIAPGLVVHESEFGKVSLSKILEVREAEVPPVCEGVVTHETATPSLLVSTSVSKSLRTTKLTNDIQALSSHLQNDELTSMVFTSQAPFKLDQFQDFLACGLPKGLRRMKGWVFFDHDTDGQQWSFHLSGRRRYECVIEPTYGASRVIRIVLIGKNLDCEGIQKQLESALASSWSSASSSSPNSNVNHNEGDTHTHVNHEHTSSGDTLNGGCNHKNDDCDCDVDMVGTLPHAHTHAHANANSDVTNTAKEKKYLQALAIIEADDRFEVYAYDADTHTRNATTTVGTNANANTNNNNNNTNNTIIVTNTDTNTNSNSNYSTTNSTTTTTTTDIHRDHNRDHTRDHVLFRMTAEKTLAVALTDITGMHGVDLNKVNLEVLARTNYANGPSFLTYEVRTHALGPSVYLRYATTGDQQLKDVWPTIDVAATSIMKTTFSHVQACRCGW